MIAQINPILRGWVNYFAVVHSSRCFSHIRDWVEKKARRHLARASQRRGFGWQRWSSKWLCVPGRDRFRLERLCRYAGRPPLAQERLSLLPDGRLLYRLKRSWRNGTTHVVYEPITLIEKLAALVPPPRFNLVRYHGILASAARSRRQILPARAAAAHASFPRHCCCPALGRQEQPRRGMAQPSDRTLSIPPPSRIHPESNQSILVLPIRERPPSAPQGQGAPQTAPETSSLPPPATIQPSRPECGPEAKGHSAVRPRNDSWAELMRRVFSVDVLECPHCGGRMRIIAAIHPPEAIRKILDCLALPSRAPPVAEAAAEERADFEVF